MHWRYGEDGSGAHLHLGPPLSHGLRRYVIRDATVRACEGAGGAPSVGRVLRTVPERTRAIIEARDRGCRVPGCDRCRHLQIHHIQHWEDGGPTDSWNLVALGSDHHRAHRRGKLGTSGNADAAGGVVFTDAGGRHLTGCGRPAPPGQLVIAGRWTPPSGERLDPKWVYLGA